MVNFNIVEGAYFREYDRFVELYNNPEYGVRDIMSELDVSVHRYLRIQEELASMGRIVKPRPVRKVTRHEINPIFKMEG